MTLYLVVEEGDSWESGYYREPVKIFSTREKAENWIQWANTHYPSRNEGYRIEEMEVDN